MGLIAFDTQIVVYALNASAPEHPSARRFLEKLAESDSVVVCELVLIELYGLLRNPAVFPNPASPVHAVERVDAFRRHPRWRLVDYPGEVPTVMDRIWAQAAAPDFARRRIFDARLAGALRHHGVTQFATANVRHFDGLGFERVWNPTALAVSPG